MPRTAPDQEVWQTCQRVGALLITANRSSGVGSLDEAFRVLGHSEALPVLTLGNANRVLRDPQYARRWAVDLLDYAERIDELRGTGRLFLPQG